MYYHDLARECWVQVNTETNHGNFRPLYVCRDDDGVWWISHTLGGKGGYLKNETKSEEIPTTGWKVNFRLNSIPGWKVDPTLAIHHGPLIPLWDEITVTVDGPKVQEWSKQAGVYKRSCKWWSGHPVYTNSSGKNLFTSVYGWSVAGELHRFECDFHTTSFNHCPTLSRWDEDMTVSYSMPNPKMTTGATDKQ